MEQSSVLAAESSNVATGIGAAIGAVIAIGGYLWQARGSKTDSATKLVDAAMTLVLPLHARIDALEAELAECNAKHERAEAALRAAGILP